MEKSVYARMAANEAAHWWFSGRRAIIAALVSREIRPARSARVLEVGCGSGGNLELLSRFGHLDGSNSTPNRAGPPRPAPASRSWPEPCRTSCRSRIEATT